jgi:ribosomal protein L37E
MMPDTLPPYLTLETIVNGVKADDYRGFCLACGAEAFNVEPDARDYKCETCGMLEVFGAEELLIRYAR